MVRDLIIMAIIVSALASFSIAEAYQEGPTGWKLNLKWFRVHVTKHYFFTAYHIVMFFFLFPMLIIVLPLFLVGWDVHLFAVLLFSYVLGMLIEDFLWFVINPDFEFSKWNPRHTTWYPWVIIGRFHLPLPYIVGFVVTSVLLTYIVKGW